MKTNNKILTSLQELYSDEEILRFSSWVASETVKGEFKSILVNDLKKTQIEINDTINQIVTGLESK